MGLDGGVIENDERNYNVVLPWCQPVVLLISYSSNLHPLQTLSLSFMFACKENHVIPTARPFNKHRTLVSATQSRLNNNNHNRFVLRLCVFFDGSREG